MASILHTKRSPCLFLPTLGADPETFPRWSDRSDCLSAMTSYGDVRQIIQDVLMLIDTARDIRKAPLQRQELAEETKRLGNLLDDTSSRWNEFEDKHLFKEVEADAAKCLSKLRNRLADPPNGFRKHSRRFKWSLQKADIQKALERIRQLNDQLGQLMHSKVLSTVTTTANQALAREQRQ